MMRFMMTRVSFKRRLKRISLMTFMMKRMSFKRMMKRMSFKRMMKRMSRVEPCSTRCDMELPTNGAFFEQANSFGILEIHSFSYSMMIPLSLCFQIENSLQQMKRCQRGFFLLP
ncbi:hypothetical protein LINPERPRIM_LOCUS45072 [Linum perenne]